MPDHSPEPWIALFDTGVTDDLERPIIHEGVIDARGNSIVGDYMLDADRRRIIACVNACAGVRSDVLEKIKVADLIKAPITPARRAEILDSLQSTRNTAARRARTKS